MYSIINCATVLPKLPAHTNADMNTNSINIAPNTNDTLLGAFINLITGLISNSDVSQPINNPRAFKIFNLFMFLFNLLFYKRFKNSLFKGEIVGSNYFLALIRI